MKTIELEKTTYQPLLTEMETESAIAELKSYFAVSLSKSLGLTKVEAPLVVEQGTGINDDLNGIESPVTVNVKELPQVNVEIVHSLAKWKRVKLARLKTPPDQGLITDMKALRPDEDFSEVHSIYVDQWDWEKVIEKSDRNLDCLKKTVTSIYASIVDTEKHLAKWYRSIKPYLPESITFIHTEELLALYPLLTTKEREHNICKEHGAVFLIGIGGELADGKKHDGRAPDYDDWSTATSVGKRGLNGDILVWNNVLGKAFELSSMGIRVSPEALYMQLFLTGQEDRINLAWHQQLIKEELPYSIGGGIGQSRLAMLLLQKKHIGEVQSSIWPEQVIKELNKQNIHLL